MSTAAGPAWPTVVIGGAPRSGTTNLYDLLQGTHAFRHHPRKELFLLNDVDFWIQATSPGYAEAGEQCYEHAGFRRQDCFVDASTTYLYQETAPAACARWLSANRERPFAVVFCLREPAERLYSNFHYFRDVLQRISARTSFAEHVDTLLDGALHTGNQQIDQALEHGLYPQYLGRWETAVGADRIMLVRTEELAESPQSVVSRIGDRIGLQLAMTQDARKNESYRPRYRGLQTIARMFGSIIPRGPARESLKRAYVRLAPEVVDSSAHSGEHGTMELVRNYYRAQAAAFAGYGLNWYGTA